MSGRALWTVAFVLTTGVLCRAQVPLHARLYASGFAQPVAFVQDPTDPAVQFVVQQGGRIRVVRDGEVLASDFLDLSSVIAAGGERGLLGLAFSPDYAVSGRFFVNFTDPNGNTVIARFRRSANPLIADYGSRFDLRWGGPGGAAYIQQPFSNHNGGDLAFGPDGFLYIGLGDGGFADDPGHRAQDPAQLLGKMLRIDVGVPDGHPTGYEVPPGNPFIGSGLPGVRPEIWAFGLRNPWRYSFDDVALGGTGALVIGDVGQVRFEEIDYEPPGQGGRNYGWRNREGAHEHLLSPSPAFLPLTDPILEYDHSIGHSISGGYVYRGLQLGSYYRGRYFWADFVVGKIWSAALNVDAAGEPHPSDLVEHTAELGESGAGNVSAFGVDSQGELYVVSYSHGAIFKLVPSVPVVMDPASYAGDAKADVVVYRPSTGTWWVRENGTAQPPRYFAVQWGASTDIPVPGDYDGDNTIDLAVYRPSTGVWWIRHSSAPVYTAAQWGVGTDVPMPGDYDGDGRQDLAVYRPATGVWWIWESATGRKTPITWGVSTDVPVRGDFDGDGKTDVAVFRPSTGVWWIQYSATLTYAAIQWGVSTDVPVPDDYDGDGRTDLAIYRASTGTWWILRSATMSYAAVPWGNATDLPVPGDYDADGRADVAFYRRSTGVWWILQSSDGAFKTAQWGVGSDVAIAGLK